jgi:hypothetical protein
MDSRFDLVFITVCLLAVAVLRLARFLHLEHRPDLTRRARQHGRGRPPFKSNALRGRLSSTTTAVDEAALQRDAEKKKRT